MSRYFSHCNNCGKLMILIGLLVAAPLLILPFYMEDSIYAPPFIISSVGSIMIGLLICFIGQHDESSPEHEVSIRRSSLTVLFAWAWGILIGAMPFVLSDQLTFPQALFEAVSGWTTTGLSVMDVSKTPSIFLFHRSFMQYCGGLGFVMMMVMLVQGKQSMDLYNAEGHPDKLMPNLKRTAQTIFLMYNTLLIIGTLAYRIAGMGLFDGVCHAMCSLSTGGFSTKLNSVGEYRSLAIEGVTIVLMLIGTTNFAVLLLLLERKWHQVVHVSEMRFMFIVLLVFIPLTGLSLSSSLDMGLAEGMRRATFDVVSAVSTTGYSTMSYTTWPPFAIGILILSMLIGGGIGSTAGGIKLTRVYLMLRLGWQNLRKRLVPSRNVEVSYYVKAQGKTRIDSHLASDTTGFVVCYFLIFTIGSLLLTLTANCSLSEAMFEFASAIGTVGLSIGITTTTTNTATLIVEMCGMLLGRLEIFIVLIGFYSALTAIKQTIRRRTICFNQKA